MRTVANAPIACTVVHMNEGITNYAMRNISKEAKAHFLHKPYQNDFKECREKVKNMEANENVGEY